MSQSKCSISVFEKSYFWYRIAYKKIGIFFRKKGSVTFLPFSLSNFMQGIGKILRAVFEKKGSAIN